MHLTVVYEDPGSNHTTDGRVYHAAAVIYNIGHGLRTLLQYLGRLSRPPSVERQNEYQLTGRVTITMAMVDVDGSSQISTDSQLKSIGLV